jgi:hypothetical protein
LKRVRCGRGWGGESQGMVARFSSYVNRYLAVLIRTVGR